MHRYFVLARTRLGAIAASMLIAALITTGYAADAKPNLAGSEWGFAEETGKQARFIQFREDAVGGSLGCNRFTGRYTFEDGVLKIGPLASTRMACPPDVMQRETEFAAILENARSAEPSATALVLKDADGTVLAELVRRDRN